jgi:hypothetical protein
VNNRTLANLSQWPAEELDALRAVLKDKAVPQGPAERSLAEAFEVSRSLPHGHVGALVGTLRRLGLEELVGPPWRERELVVAMVVAQVISPGSKLAFARGARPETATTSLGEACSAATADEDDLYGAMDWLLPCQGAIEDALAARHLSDGVLVAYDVSSAAFEGLTCPLGALGHLKDGVHGRLQIVYGLSSRPRANRWRSRSSRAAPGARRPSAPRWTSSGSASVSAASASWATGKC